MGRRLCRTRRLIAWWVLFCFTGTQVAIAAGPLSPAATPAGASLESVAANDQLTSAVQAAASMAHVADPVAARTRLLGGDVERCFRFVRDHVDLEVYPGVLRGARGTLLGRAGNAADRSLLLAALLGRAHPVRFAMGTLGPGRARALVTRMLTPRPEPPTRPPTADTVERRLASSGCETCVTRHRERADALAEMLSRSERASAELKGLLGDAGVGPGQRTSWDAVYQALAGEA
ncbi:MAG: hypothetical protein HY815_31725, partial [Candidatus Riflebacteria bacterium]|nr:hypothetical protein [Candidatus Riflebacteria bacterium]